MIVWILSKFPDADVWIMKLSNIEGRYPARSWIDIYDFFNYGYDGTRLNCSSLEREYGFDDFEKNEICDCIRTFDKFVQLEDWNVVFQNKVLVYKRYLSSAQGKNWFLTSKYSDQQIDKFHCVNPKRCFRHRNNGIFYILRMERDYSISDNG